MGELRFNLTSLPWVCEDCGWLVLAEKFYFWCIGCERIAQKKTALEILGLE